MNISSLCTSLCLLLSLSFAAFAEQSDTEQEPGFQLAFTGTAVLGDGTEVDVNFPVAFEQMDGIWYFRAGRQRLAMSAPPESYNVQLAVFEEDSMVFIQEFADRYMTSFKVQIGEHTLELESASGSALYGLRLVIDDRALRFEKRTPSIRFELDEYGITGIKSDGFVRDLSTRRVE
ncbi:MAG: hypothetical protein HLUCCO02_01375 [Idiomarinaceae bacterium HL-53]|nr:MAG: hypothetical protein HLUCCO02_01375 [Idiomarinaceae bacterium HL-53]CUS48677.1 hypothetical protein Ga0003345_1647 [Idiomarinaceae bacterium HL-53]